MLPLRATEGVERFPKVSLMVLLLFLGVEVVVRLWPGLSHHEFLIRFAPIPYGWNPKTFNAWAHLFFSNFLFESLFSLWIACLYVWSFTPRLFEKRPLYWVFPGSFLAMFLSFLVYRSLQGSNAQAPVLLSQVWVSALLGISMRSEIWSSVTTLVFGPKLFQVFEVPSYVLLFFWFFYLMLGNLFMASPFSDAPTLYFLPLMAFILGFLMEALVIQTQKMLFQRHDNTL
jgi:hypothetical protein